MHDLTFNDADRDHLERYVRPYLPTRIFDAHAHLFCHEHFAPGNLPASLLGTPAITGIEAYRQYINWLHPDGRTVGSLFFGLAFMGKRVANNEFVAEQMRFADAQGFRALGHMLISPEMDPEYVRQEVRRGGFVGLKPYHTMAKTNGPTFLAPIQSYLTEQHVKVAHEERLSITLHMVRDRAMADPINQAIIRRYCENYPNMQLILAHAARGFNPWHTIEGIGSLRGLRNVWFDTSAVTEAGAFEAIVDVIGPDRLLYGTDFHVSHLRGRCIAIGDSFHWLYADEMSLNEKHTNLMPVLIGLESLRSVILAMHRLRLNDRQIEDLFYGNAAQLFD